MLHVLVEGNAVAGEDHERLRREFPDVHFIVAESTEEMLRHAPKAEIIFGKGVTRAMLDAAPRLRWVQAGTAGIDGLIRQGIRDRNLLVSNARGAHGIPMAENILAMALCFATRLHLMLREQQGRGKPKARVIQEKWELHGQTMLILGLGDIGGTLARKASALGMRVLGIRRSGAPAEGCERVATPEHLHALLPEADHVALCLPLTDETAAIIGEPELRLMKRTAHIYNVGRGASIDPVALRRALSERWIAGAGLDCVAPSDVPADDDPLWEMQEVILSMHTSGHSPYNSRRITDIFAGNLRAYLDGRPLETAVDLSLGY